MKPRPTIIKSKPSFFLLTAFYSLFFLCLGNLLGLVLSLLLLFPELNNFLVPFTYGRLMPLHLNFQLYGWSSLPVLGILLKWFLPGKKLTANSQKIYIAWTVCLVIGGLSWLAGMSGGKIFLDWAGPFKILFPISLFLLWLTVVFSFHSKIKIENLRISDTAVIIRGSLLLILLAVPFAFWFALDPKLYPPIDINSGGPTGVDLLGSVLGIIFLFLIFPPVLGIKIKEGKQPIRLPFLILLFQGITFLFLNRQNSSNYDLQQIFALSSVLIWIPILFWFYAQFEFSKPAILWLKSFAVWWTILSVSAFLMFLPGNLEIVKFTNVLVAHAHLAMAGMLSSFVILLLVSLEINDPRVTLLAKKTPFLLWQSGSVIMLTALVSFGIFENDPNRTQFLPDSLSFWSYTLRSLGGLLMTIASGIWFLSIAQCFSTKRMANRNSLTLVE
jgi:cytochrome c oxidase cbb3-type subunit I